MQCNKLPYIINEVQCIFWTDVKVNFKFRSVNSKVLYADIGYDNYNVFTKVDNIVTYTMQSETSQG